MPSENRAIRMDAAHADAPEASALTRTPKGEGLQPAAVRPTFLTVLYAAAGSSREGGSPNAGNTSGGNVTMSATSPSASVSTSRANGR